MCYLRWERWLDEYMVGCEAHNNITNQIFLQGIQEDFLSFDQDHEEWIAIGSESWDGSEGKPGRHPSMNTRGVFKERLTVSQRNGGKEVAKLARPNLKQSWYSAKEFEFIF